MKKCLKIFSLLLVCIIVVSGCSIGTKKVTYKGSSFNVIFEVKNDKKYVLSTDSKDAVNMVEKSVLLGNGYKIGIEENNLIQSFSGDFNKLKDNFKDEPGFKEVTYGNKDGFQKYYSVYSRYEVYLPVNDKVVLKLNIYSDKNNKDNALKVLNSKEVKDVLNSIKINTK